LLGAPLGLWRRSWYCLISLEMPVRTIARPACKLWCFGRAGRTPSSGSFSPSGNKVLQNAPCGLLPWTVLSNVAEAVAEGARVTKSPTKDTSAPFLKPKGKRMRMHQSDTLTIAASRTPFRFINQGYAPTVRVKSHNSETALPQYAGLATPQEGPVRLTTVNPDRDLPNGFGRELLVGMTTERALEIARDAGVAEIRVIQTIDGLTITPMNMDLWPARLRLFVEAGVVVGASFG
jgi:hypothetical protein